MIEAWRNPANVFLPARSTPRGGYPTNRKQFPILCGVLLLIAAAAPLVSAAPPPDTAPHVPPTQWVFITNQEGEWRATSEHWSFQWTLKPFTLYDVMHDGVEVMESFWTPLDATGFDTHGGVFVVMMGKTPLMTMVDSPTAEIQFGCVQSPRDPAVPPDPCQLMLPEGSEGYANSENNHVSQFHIELPTDADAISPCIKATVRGDSSFEENTITFVGDLNFRMPPGLAMSEEIE